MNRILKQWLLAKSKILSRKGLYEFLTAQYSIIPSGADVLSIGAGGEVNALLQEYAKQNGFSVLTFDIDKKREPDILGDICAYDFGGKLFDVVIMSEVLEHLHSPQDANAS